MTVVDTERTLDEQEAFVNEFLERFDAVEVTRPEHRRKIFEKQRDKGVSDERLQELLVEVCGQPSTQHLSPRQVNTILTALEAEA